MEEASKVTPWVASLREGPLRFLDRAATKNEKSRLALGKISFLRDSRRIELDRLLADPASRPNFDLVHEHETGILWMTLRRNAPPILAPTVLEDILRIQRAIAGAGDGVSAPLPRHLVIGSAIPGAFGYGGDLALMLDLIRARDADGLRHYGELGIEVVHGFDRGCGRPLTTIALIEGDAFGGSLEGALACHVIVAERRARLRFPEALFGLVPGAGAASLLVRRAGWAAAERMIADSRACTAAEGHALGLVDVLAEDGDGRAAVRRLIAARERRPQTFGALRQLRQIAAPVTRAELAAEMGVWVEAALALSDADLARMARLAHSQGRRRAGPSVGGSGEETA